MIIGAIMIPTLSDIRRQNLQKATLVRQSEFKSSIHALPPKIKARIDHYLSLRYSPYNALVEVCKEFPRAELPSPKAVENYRNKYHTKALTTYRALRKDFLLTEFNTLRTKNYIVTKTIPLLTQRLTNLIARENELGGIPLKSTTDALRGLTKLLSKLQ